MKNVYLVSRDLSYRYKDVCKKLATRIFITALSKMSKKKMDYIHCGVGITMEKGIKNDGVEMYLLM